MKFSLRDLLSKRRWFQFSLKTLFVAMTLVAVVLGMWVFYIRPAEQQREAVRYVERLGGGIKYADATQNESWPIRQLRKWLPRDYFDEVTTVVLSSAELEDDDLDHLQAFTNLQILALDYTNVTDAALIRIRRLPSLRVLHLNSSRITGDGFVNLEGLKQLKHLRLSGTKVNDASLVSLKELSALESLTLGNTKVTDAGIIHLQGLTQLRKLELGERVTEEGASKLREYLPDCRIIEERPRQP